MKYRKNVTFFIIIYKNPSGHHMQCIQFLYYAFIFFSRAEKFFFYYYYFLSPGKEGVTIVAHVEYFEWT
jgi:hypothetical protein